MATPRNRVAGLLFAAALVLSVLPAVSVRADGRPEQSRRLTILHLCDVYEVEAVGPGGSQGGFARLKTLIDRTRWEDPQALVFLSGDFLSPSLMSNTFKGRQMIDLLNRVGIDYAMPGNHEFDFGVPTLVQRVKESRFTWITSNILGRGGRHPPWQLYAMRRVNGLNVGIFSLITPETRDLARGTEEWFRFTDPIHTARSMVKRLRGMGAQVIIAMAHLDYADDLRLAHAVPGIDIILGGHDHIIKKEVAGKTLIIESGSDLRVAGRIDYDPKRAKDHMPVLFLEIDNSLEQDPGILERLEAYRKELKETLGQVIGTTTVALNAKRIDNRSLETNLGDLIADAGRAALQAEIGLQNSGIIRSDAIHGPGELTREDIQRILPFNNILVKLTVSGLILRAALEHGVSQMDRVKGRFLQVSGLEVVVDPSFLPGHRIVAVTVGGVPLDPNRQYSVAVNDYMAQGGDGFDMLTDAPRLVSVQFGPRLTDVVIQHVIDAGRISPEVTGRIRFVGP